MALGRKSGAVRDTGSGYAKFYESDADGLALGAVTDLPWIKESTLEDETEEVEIETEGEDSFFDDGSRTVTWEATFIQSDKDTIEMMAETYRGKYMTICKEFSDKTVVGNYPYLVMAICKVQPNISKSNPGSDIAAKWTLQTVTADLTIDLTTFDGTFKGTLTGNAVFTTTGYKYWQLIEIAA